MLKVSLSPEIVTWVAHQLLKPEIVDCRNITIRYTRDISSSPKYQSWSRCLYDMPFLGINRKACIRGSIFQRFIARIDLRYYYRVFRGAFQVSDDLLVAELAVISELEFRFESLTSFFLHSFKKNKNCKWLKYIKL